MSEDTHSSQTMEFYDDLMIALSKQLLQTDFDSSQKELSYENYSLIRAFSDDESLSQRMG